jgi:hypothetical protein
MHFATSSVLLWHQTDPGREVTPGFEGAGVDDGRDHCGGRNHANAGNRCQPQAHFVRTVASHKRSLGRLYLRLQVLDLHHDQFSAGPSRLREDGVVGILSQRVEFRDAPDTLRCDQVLSRMGFAGACKNVLIAK